MNLDGLVNLLRNEARYQALLRTLAEERPGRLSLGLLEAARPYVLNALHQDWPGALLIVSASPESARNLADQLHAWSSQPERILYYPPPDVLFYDHTSWDADAQQQRASVLTELTRRRENGTGEAGIIVTSTWALMPKSVPPPAFRRALRTLQAGQRITINDLLVYLATNGFKFATVVDTPGTFSHRGSIVDIFSPQYSRPVRLDFWGDEIDTMRWYDPASQRSAEKVESLTLGPASEALPAYGKTAAAVLETIDLSTCDTITRQHLAEEFAALREGRVVPTLTSYLAYLYPRPANLLDFLPPGTLLFLDDLTGVEAASETLENQALALRAEMQGEGSLPLDWLVPYFTWSELRAMLEAHRAVNLGYDAEDNPPYLGERTFISVPQFAGQLRYALSDIAELARSQRVVIVTRQTERLTDLLHEQAIATEPVTEIIEPPAVGSVSLVDGIIGEGWAYTPEQLVLLTDVEIFGWARPRKRRTLPEHRISPEVFYSDLRDGDYVVHLEHGIARYHGMVRKTINNLEREYLELEYAAGDRLFVPVHQADRVGRYVGPNDEPPELHRLGSHDWE
ncbi:MAG: CarD family transcriptional regulator, partial [Anaerolineae bacterium]